MGRELKRVPIDFDWPQEKTWSGYESPSFPQCETCGGQGDTMAMRRLSEIVGVLLLSGSDALGGKVHPYFRAGFFYDSQNSLCGMDMLDLTEGLAGRPATSFGHDALDRWSAIRKIVAAAGLSEKWGTCQDCDGCGRSPENQAKADAWTRTEPPVGDGYQIWETVSDGSPISPVFATPELLATYMAGRKWGADTGSSYETWLRFITGPGWAPSVVMEGGQMKSGVEALCGDGATTEKTER